MNAVGAEESNDNAVISRPELFAKHVDGKLSNCSSCSRVVVMTLVGLESWTDEKRVCKE